jgi:hypothetical protein
MDLSILCTVGVVRTSTSRTLPRGMRLRRFIVGLVERSSNDSGVQVRVLAGIRVPVYGPITPIQRVL